MVVLAWKGVPLTMRWNGFAFLAGMRTKSLRRTSGQLCPLSKFSSETPNELETEQAIEEFRALLREYNGGQVAPYSKEPVRPQLTPERTQALEEYTREFIRKTNDGRVCTFDVSYLDTRDETVRTQLTPEEKKQWEEWHETRSYLENYYDDVYSSFEDILSDLTPHEVLLLRVAPAFLGNVKRWPRSKPDETLERVYPGETYHWVDFENEVRSFTEPAVELCRGITDVLYSSLDAWDAWVRQCDENRERIYIVNHVLRALHWAGLLKCGYGGDAHLLEHTHPLGNADHILIAGRDKTVPIAFRATQDFLVPEKAVEITHRYNTALLELKTNRKRTTDWTNIGRPVAQVISYMFLARSRYGVLSSGTRSYFFKVEITDNGPRVSITDAWFVGGKDYLRALAYVYRLAKANGDFEIGDGAETEWPTWTPGNSTSDRDQQGSWVGPEDRDGAEARTDERPSKNRKSDDAERDTGGSPTANWLTWLDPGLAPSIPRVDSRDIKFIRLLGHGRNAAYLADWKGAEAAIKVFDVYKAFAAFDDEVRAYEQLKDAWGVLVPEPYFLAEIYGVVLFGMQLGRSPNSDDVDIKSEQDILFRTLQLDYGIHHLDQETRNVIYLPDKSGTGKDRLVAIDFERYKLLRWDGS